MNLLFISTIFPSSHKPTRGIYSLYLLTALRDMGWTIEVINPFPFCPGVDNFIRKKVFPPAHETLNELPVTHAPFFYTPGYFVEKHYWFYRKAVAKKMKSGIARLKERSPNPELPIHVMLGFVYPDAFAMAPICQRLELDYSVMIYGSDFLLRRFQPKFSPLVMQCLQEAPKIFCPGYVLKEEMIKEGIDGLKIHSFYNGIDTNVFHTPISKAASSTSSKFKPHSNTILFVGNLLEVKKVDRLLKAFTILVREKTSNSRQTEFNDLHLNIIGDGALAKVLKRLVQELHIEQQVHFAGRELASQIAARMQNAKCLCLCSYSEGMPNVVLEALACGCPVVATDVGEVPRLIEEGINGYTVATREQSEEQIIESLVQALRKALSHEWDRQQIAKKMNRYTWPAAARIVSSALLK